MHFMKMLLPHSAASGSSSGKSELPEGATCEADSCHQGRYSPPSAYTCTCIIIIMYNYMQCSC